MKPIGPVLCVVAALATTLPASAQGKSAAAPANKPATTPAAPNPHTPNPNASADAQAIQAVLQKFDASRDQIVAQRQALIDQLAGAKTQADRQAILDQLKAEEQSVQDQQRTTAKEIRSELQALRRQRGG